MLYVIKDFVFSGDQYGDNSRANREFWIQSGCVPVWFDGIPDFYRRWQSAGPDAQGEIRITLTLKEYKDVRRAELDYLSRQFDDELVNPAMYFKSSLGFEVDADIRSQNNLRGLQATQLPEVQFMGHDNELHPITQADISTLLSECAQNGSNLYAQRWQYRAAIDAAQTLEELAAIDFNFKMTDFDAA